MHIGADNMQGAVFQFKLSQFRFDQLRPFAAYFVMPDHISKRWCEEYDQLIAGGIDFLIDPVP